MYTRLVERRVEEALSDTPVVLVTGPRRAGKTTLVRKMGEAGRTYVTLDDQTALEAARNDPRPPENNHSPLQGSIFTDLDPFLAI